MNVDGDNDGVSERDRDRDRGLWDNGNVDHRFGQTDNGAIEGESHSV